MREQFGVDRTISWHRCKASGWSIVKNPAGICLVDRISSTTLVVVHSDEVSSSFRHNPYFKNLLKYQDCYRSVGAGIPATGHLATVS